MFKSPQAIPATSLNLADSPGAEFLRKLKFERVITSQLNPLKVVSGHLLVSFLQGSSGVLIFNLMTSLPSFPPSRCVCRGWWSSLPPWLVAMKWLSPTASWSRTNGWYFLPATSFGRPIPWIATFHLTHFN